MIKTIIYAAGIGLFSAQLTGCGGEGEDPQGNSVTPNDIIAGPICEYLEGRTYFTAQLASGGATEQGVAQSHWTAHFADGEAQFFQTDYGLVGSYTCSEGKVVLSLGDNEPVTLQFDHGENSISSHLQPFRSFSFNPIGEQLREYVAVEVPQGQRHRDCNTVAGRSYTAVATATGDAIAVEVPFINFGEGQAVEYEIRASGAAPVHGVYECDTGVIHLHEQGGDEEPIVVTLTDDAGNTLLAEQGDYSVAMEEAGSDCLRVERELCVVEPQQVQCFTTPCPDGFHKTVTQSHCADSLMAPYQIIHEGPCGDQEGQPYYDEGECADTGAVCAAMPSKAPCGAVPCPSLEQQTFASKCEARLANAPIVDVNECGEREGEPVTEIPIACTQEAGYPVCAKAPAHIQCITEPCPSHQYQTFPSQCDADVRVSDTAFEGDCGGLQGAVAGAEPPVRMVAQLPEVEKQVSITNASFTGDTLTLELGYSGCSEQHFHLSIGTAFKESSPVQVDYTFVPMVEDDCLAYFTTEFSYDLAPLKHLYQRAYQAESGSINLPGIGVYSF